MDFSVTILGSGAAVPTSRRNPSSQYIQCRNRHFLIDCGEGTQMQMRKFGVSFNRITHVFISHLHGDHFFGLVGLLSTMHLMGRVKAIHIYGPVGLKEIIQMQLEVAKGKLAYDLIFREIEPEETSVLFEDDKVSVACFPLVHKIPTSGFRIEEKERERTLLAEKARADGVKLEYFHRLKKGEDIEEDGTTISHLDYTKAAEPPKSYAYCSDTALSDKTVAAVAGVNFLYHEATFIEALRDRAKATKHSTARDAAEVAKRAKVGKLLMGHLSARYDSGKQHLEESKEVFLNSECVEDGQVIEVI
ncbi:ribonuclease Z [Crocinitomicaceae bacterium]|nr:ribonuclease Z [Crocinitomicaceae bacterium]MDC0257455.1 ribonuclease Z [Crocinitomicaceae bacterium]